MADGTRRDPDKADGVPAPGRLEQALRASLADVEAQPASDAEVTLVDALARKIAERQRGDDAAIPSVADEAEPHIGG